MNHRLGFSRYLSKVVGKLVSAKEYGSSSDSEVQYMRLIRVGTSPEDIVRVLGDPDVIVEGGIAYVGICPEVLGSRVDGLVFMFEISPASGALIRARFSWMGPGNRVRSDTLHSDWSRMHAQLDRLGATEEEIVGVLGNPVDVYGWWPEEVLDYGGGKVIRLLLGVVCDP